MIGLSEVPGPNYQATQGQIEVTRDGKLIATLLPAKRVYRVQTNPMTEAAVDSNLLRDIYVSMGEELPSGEWVVRVQHKPFIVWIWGGYRQRQTSAAELPANTASAGAAA
jgi:cytochrome c-type biogenesis protein CcmF